MCFKRETPWRERVCERERERERGEREREKRDEGHAFEQIVTLFRCSLMSLFLYNVRF